MNRLYQVNWIKIQLISQSNLLLFGLNQKGMSKRIELIWIEVTSQKKSVHPNSVKQNITVPPPSYPWPSVFSLHLSSVPAVQDPEGGGVQAGAEEPGAALSGLPERQPGLPAVWGGGPHAGGGRLQQGQPALQRAGHLRGARSVTVNISHFVFYITHGVMFHHQQHLDLLLVWNSHLVVKKRSFCFDIFFLSLCWTQAFDLKSFVGSFIVKFILGHGRLSISCWLTVEFTLQAMFHTLEVRLLWFAVP